MPANVRNEIKRMCFNQLKQPNGNRTGYGRRNKYNLNFAGFKPGPLALRKNFEPFRQDLKQQFFSSFNKVFNPHFFPGKGKEIIFGNFFSSLFAQPECPSM